MNFLKQMCWGMALACVLMLGGSGSSMAATGGEAVDGAHSSSGGGGLPLAAPRLLGGEGAVFEVGFFQVTNSMVVMVIVSLGLILFSQIATRNIQMVPQGIQNFAEWIVESLQEFLAGIMGEKLARETFWYFATVFLFILSANWFGLLPGVGTIGWGTPDAEGHLHHLSHPILRGANADINMTLALALGFFFMWIVWSIRSNGVGGFFAHIFLYRGEATGGMRLLLLVMFFLVGFLEVISILIRPVTLNFRLFGNVFAGETLLETMLHMGGKLGFLTALPFYGLELMVGAIQALVFTLLTAVFTALMCHHEEEHSSHGHGHEAGGAHGGGHN